MKNNKIHMIDESGNFPLCNTTDWFFNKNPAISDDEINVTCVHCIKKMMLSNSVLKMEMIFDERFRHI